MMIDLQRAESFEERERRLAKEKKKAQHNKALASFAKNRKKRKQKR